MGQLNPSKHSESAVDARIQAMQLWLEEVLPGASAQIEPLNNDASFRRYFRVHREGERFVVMDAPPEFESTGSFVTIVEAWSVLGIHVPEIIADDAAQGFILLEDLGDRLYLSELNTDTATTLYQNAFETLHSIQSCSDIPNYVLPKYDTDLLLKEMRLYSSWYIEQYLDRSLNAAQERVLTNAFNLLIENALAQPQVCVHRDYHSRNLMILNDDQVGVLDFQDAVWGPITYDLVSLLRDCYIDWPQPTILDWARDYYEVVKERHGIENFEQFMKWFDWMGVQRHLKCIGIFARLKIRDGKSNYLQYIPRIENYLLDVTDRHEELDALRDLILTMRIPQ